MVLGHISQTFPVQNYDGSTQIKVKFHDKDEIKIGAKVGAYLRSYSKSLPMWGFERLICKYKQIGDGRVVKILDENVGLIEFASEVEINDTIEFEVKE